MSLIDNVKKAFEQCNELEEINQQLECKVISLERDKRLLLSLLEARGFCVESITDRCIKSTFVKPK